MLGQKRRHGRREGADLQALVARLAADTRLREELGSAATDLRDAWSRVRTKRSGHGLRNALVVAGVGGAVAVVAYPRARKALKGAVARLARRDSAARTIIESIEVGAPVTAVYGQWTQFEDFPLFMEGIEHVEQLDETRLRWVASVAGREAEWEAKILEQHRDRQISWISVDGRKTRGTVTFEERGPATTLVTLSMSYRAEGVAEAVGSAAGLDRRRVLGDLERFKELVESRDAGRDAWQGEVSAGQATTDE